MALKSLCLAAYSVECLEAEAAFHVQFLQKQRSIQKQLLRSLLVGPCMPAVTPLYKLGLSEKTHLFLQQRENV